jgi:hypothetical protein
MDTPYERLEPDIRGEWLDHPTTVAFLGTVRLRHDQIVASVVASLASGGFDSKMQFYGGEIAAMRFVLDLPARGKK